jgi:hypothetical protein
LKSQDKEKVRSARKITPSGKRPLYVNGSFKYAIKEKQVKGPFIFYQEGGWWFLQGGHQKNSDVKGGSPQEN